MTSVCDRGERAPFSPKIALKRHNFDQELIMKLYELAEKRKAAKTTKKRDKTARDGSNANNLVAKHAREFNKAATHRDRKNDYKRKSKHTQTSEY